MTDRNLRRPIVNVAVIGAGISGLSCANALADAGVEVTVFEKSRGVGGRMATRRIDHTTSFDHGAQFFTVTDDRFRDVVQSWEREEVVQRWRPRIGVIADGQFHSIEDRDRFVGIPTMNGVCRHLIQHLKGVFEARINALSRIEHLWGLEIEKSRSRGGFDYVVSSIPPAQCLEIFPKCEMTDQISAHQMTSCWTVMIQVADRLQLDFDAAVVRESRLSWIARNSSKPMRDSGLETWVLQASPEWSGMNLENDRVEVRNQLIEEFWRVTHHEPVSAKAQPAHRWRFAQPILESTQQCYFDPVRKLGACGDWCDAGNVEGAYLSGLAMANCVLVDAAS